MSVVATISNRFLEQYAGGISDLSSNVIKAILLDGSQTFNPATDDTLSDVTSQQLATGSGYTQDEKTLSGATITRDDSENTVTISFDDITWIAAGGDIGPFEHLVLYDDTTSDDTIIVSYNLNETITISSGDGYQFNDLSIELSQNSGE